MTKAAEDFKKSIEDAESILKFVDKYKGDKAAEAPADIEALKRAGLILALASWETYVENCVREKVDGMLKVIAGSPVACIVKEQLEVDIKHCNNPNTDRTRTLFRDYVRVDVTENWKDTQTDLDGWMKLRGEAAHLAPRKTDEKGSPTPHLVGRDKLGKVINGLKKLVDACEAKVATV
jgi:hypothetical protein